MESNVSLLELTTKFYRHINNLDDVESELLGAVNRSKVKGWYNIQLSCDDASACMRIMKEGRTVLMEIFEEIKQAYILSEKNRAITERLTIYPMQKTFNDYVTGKVDATATQAAIDQFIGKKRAA